MRILVTGGTGFVGSHVTGALMRAGHDVRLLARSPEKVAATFGPLGIDPPTDVVRGDITDAASIAAAARGGEAVLHAASIFSLDRREAAATRRTNVAGTRNVIEAALAVGMDPIVHVSSYGALIPVADGRLHPDAPPSTGVGPYTTSKAEQERLARQYQAEGLPIVTVMPGSVWGPGDPYFGESDQLAASILKGRLRTLPRRDAFPIVDVRDVAEAMARIFERGRGPRRYLLGGKLVSPAGVADLLAHATGVRRRYLAIPPSMARQGGMAFDLAQRVSPWRLPLTREATQIGTQPLVRVDDSRAEAELEFRKRPLEGTVADTVRWLVHTDRVSPRQAGRLGHQTAVV
ncbi:MAG: NAD-dependent epimerase/dehydratase family protein, partial [Tepidiformaceae bacterium]